jgi:hypothetical protein
MTMTRQSAINAVVDAVKAAIDVAAVRALCVGGVHRGRGPGRVMPFVDLVGASESEWDTLGRRAPEVRVPITVTTSGAHPDGDEQATAIMAKVVELASAITTVTGWHLCLVTWDGTEMSQDTAEDGTPIYTRTATMRYWVEA